LSQKGIELVDGGGNVFRDFGDPQADLKQAKTVLAMRIIVVLDERGLAVRAAANLTGFAAADFSRIRNAGLGRFTLERLMRIGRSRRQRQRSPSRSTCLGRLWLPRRVPADTRRLSCASSSAAPSFTTTGVLPTGPQAAS